MKIYFISGLAADSRVFRNIRLPEGFEAVYLEWIPCYKGESLTDYARRMAEGINPAEPFGLLGLSMGGMMVCEIAKLYRPEVVFLISSIPVSKDLPFYYRWLGVLQFHRLLPIGFFQRLSLIKRVFAKETPEEKEILRAMVRNADTNFVRWSMKAILDWTNADLPKPIVHIHGTSDEILPCRFTHPTHKIIRGTHLMVLDRAREINGILAAELEKLNRPD